MNENKNNNAQYEFSALLLGLLPSLLILLIISFLYYIDGMKINNFSCLLFFSSLFIACITHALMGFEVNRKVRRIDLLQGGLGLEILKTYYKEIARYKKFPLILVLFILSSTVFAGVIVYSYIDDGNWIAAILILIVVLLLVFISYMAKKYNFQNSGE